jgi:hypothetical protein
MTTQHNLIMIYSPKADGIDQDGRPAARHVLSRSGWRHLRKPSSDFSDARAHQADRRADHPRAERRDSCRKGRSGQRSRAAAPAPEQTPFPAKLWRVRPMRPQPHAARVAKGSWLVDSIWQTNVLGAAALSRMDCLDPAPNNCPDRACPLHRLEGLDEGSIVNWTPVLVKTARLPFSCVRLRRFISASSARSPLTFTDLVRLRRRIITS